MAHPDTKMNWIQFTMLALGPGHEPVDDDFPVQCAMNELLPHASLCSHLGDGNWLIELPEPEAMRLSESAAAEGYFWHETTELGGNRITLII